MHIRQMPQTMRCRVKECTENARALALEVPSQRLLRSSLILRNCFQRQKNRTVGKVWPTDYVVNPVEYHRSRGVKKNLVAVGVELTNRKSAAGSEPTKRVRQPSR